MAVKNAKGKGTIWYGMHFYPGVAEYQEPGKDPYRVFLNEDTIRSMDPSFSGCPVFVMHVDEVEPNIDVLKAEADGWVVESFYNEADGKHWVKFVTTSERADKAIRNGMRLSNSYFPRNFAQGGLWNGVSYQKEITSGEYEHLAIVPNPRYDESKIMTPDEFKVYNAEKVAEIKRLSNSEENTMVFKWIKRTKVDNAPDLEGMSVVLPKSGKEMTVTQLVSDMDDLHDVKNANYGMAHPDHMVDMGEGKKMSVKDMCNSYKAMHEELSALKKDATEEEPELEEKDATEEEPELEEKEEKVDVEGDDKAKNDDDGDKDEDDKKEKAEKKKNELADARKKAKEKADALRNAQDKTVEEATLDLPEDMVARGKSRYGS